MKGVMIQNQHQHQHIREASTAIKETDRERERERERQVRCQTAAVAAGQGLRAVTHTGTPCRSHNVGEGLSVQQLRGEERWMSVCVC